jgi:hypothetical protein
MYYLGGVIISINNKFIINRDILNSKIRVLSIIKFFSSEYQEGRQKTFFSWKICGVLKNTRKK